MAGTERVVGTTYRRALVALAAVLVVGGASLTSPTILSSHSAPPGTSFPSLPVVSESATPTPTSLPTPTVAGTADPDPDNPSGLPTATPVPSEPTATMTNLHKITVKRVTVPFTTVTKKDPDLAKGKTKVLRDGVNGIKEVTYTDGKVTATKVIKKPVSKLVAIGTKTVKPWLGDKQCGTWRDPYVRVRVNDPDKVGYRLTLTWGNQSQVYKKSGTNTFEFRPAQSHWWWGQPACDARLG
jgi:Uncharacterized protein conserved in bacteria